MTTRTRSMSVMKLGYSEQCPGPMMPLL
jgi:hypothetical protein